jgi:hypothetical protein
VRERTKLFVAGLFTIGLGLLPLLAAFDVIETDESDFGAPRWLVAAIGFVFTLVGAWLALTRAPDRPLVGLLRALQAPLWLTLAAGFCAAVVHWSRRVHAGPPTRAAFFTLAVVLLVFAGRELGRAVGRLRRHPHP